MSQRQNCPWSSVVLLIERKSFLSLAGRGPWGLDSQLCFSGWWTEQARGLCHQMQRERGWWLKKKDRKGAYYEKYHTSLTFTQRLNYKQTSTLIPRWGTNPVAKRCFTACSSQGRTSPKGSHCHGAGRAEGCGLTAMLSPSLTSGCPFPCLPSG